MFNGIIIIISHQKTLDILTKIKILLNKKEIKKKIQIIIVSTYFFSF